MAMLQQVVVTQIADRHADIHSRAFSTTFEDVVPAGPLSDVLDAAIRNIDLPEGRYTITVDWPFEEE